MNDFSTNQPQILNQPQTRDWRLMLTAAERAAMLQDIVSVSLAAGVKLFPEQPWSPFGVALEASGPAKSPIEQLGFIEHLLPQLSRHLCQIAQSPLSSTTTYTRQVRPALARRVTAAAWMSHVRQVQSQPPLQETTARFSLDTPENRAVKSFVEVLRHDCQTIALLADAETEAEASERAWRCAGRLDQIACERWWDEVAATRGDWTLPPTQRGSLRPDYSAVFRQASQYRRGFSFDWDSPLPTLPPRETWQLYETWCLLMVFQALRDLGWDPAPASEVFAVRTGRLTLTLAVGQPSQIRLRSASGRTLTLTYNRTFAEGRESLTHTMRPDITLSDGERIWILDAKFKPYSEPGEEGEDINQMHAYKDGIVGSRSRAVACAWCLYVGSSGTPNQAHITYGRGIKTPIGALCLRPGSAETRANLRRLLQSWLA